MQRAFESALGELGAVAAEIDAGEVDRALEAITEAGKIVLYGCGREGLQMQGFAMRLYHLGLDVAMQGDMTTPALGKGDLFIVSDGPGHLATVAALTRVAQDAGARVLLLTAEPASEIARRSDLTVAVPAQTMARDQAVPTSALPMGSVYEGALFLLFEIMVLELGDRVGASTEDMRARHTNLE